MQMCNKCFEKMWKYEYIEGWIRATCQMCSNEIEFESKRTKKVRQGKVKGGATANFQTHDGVLYRFNKQGQLREVELEQSNKGLHLADKRNKLF